MGAIVSILATAVDFVISLIVNVVYFLLWLVMLPIWALFYVLTGFGRLGGIRRPGWGWRYRRSYLGWH